MEGIDVGFNCWCSELGNDVKQKAADEEKYMNPVVMIIMDSSQSGSVVDVFMNGRRSTGVRFAGHNRPCTSCVNPYVQQRYRRIGSWNLLKFNKNSEL